MTLVPESKPPHVSPSELAEILGITPQAVRKILRKTLGWQTRKDLSAGGWTIPLSLAKRVFATYSHKFKEAMATTDSRIIQEEQSLSSIYGTIGGQSTRKKINSMCYQHGDWHLWVYGGAKQPVVEECTCTGS